jgi:hypothetical protein
VLYQASCQAHFATFLFIVWTFMQENLPPTDSRLRPDQRCLENGEYERANAEKLRLEQRQRQVSMTNNFLVLCFYKTFVLQIYHLPHWVVFLAHLHLDETFCEVIVAFCAWRKYLLWSLHCIMRNNSHFWHKAVCSIVLKIVDLLIWCIVSVALPLTILSRPQVR